MRTKKLAFVSGLLLVTVSAWAGAPIALPEVRGQIVRIELPGRNKVLSLAEVEVYAKGENIAASKAATQSSVLGDGGSGAVAARAVDGSRNGDYKNKSVTHTNREESPWWEVNLGKTADIDKIIVYNRSGDAGARLDGFTLKVLDGRLEVLLSQENVSQSDKIVFMRKDLGAVWLIGDSITQSNADGDSAGSPRKSLHDLLKANGYSFSFTGHHARNVDGLPTTGDDPADNLYHYHSGISGIKIAGVTGKLQAIWGQGRLATVKPDNICIMLGTNDIGRGDIDGTPARLKTLVDKIYALPGIGRPRLFVASIPPNRRVEAQRTDVIIFNEAVQQMVTKYRSEEGAPIYFVDHFKALDDAYESTMRPDNLHPNGTGNAIMGEQWLQAMEQALVTEGAEQPEMLFPGVKTDFKGYDNYQMSIKDDSSSRDITFQIVAPEKAAPGKPWLWRNIFWTSIGRFNDTDLKLVDEGYHVVVIYGDVTGHPQGNAKVKAVYDYVTTEHGFSKTFSAAAMSRGGFMVFTYASTYPEQIEGIFMDNACANALSWPAGKPYAGHLGYEGPGSKASFQMYLEPYGFASFEEAVEYFKTAGSPIHMLEPLAKAGVPILSICGSDDHAVPYEENDAVLEERYKKLGGDITVIVEEKGHRHGTTENVSAVLDFIRKHTRQ